MKISEDKIRKAARDAILKKYIKEASSSSKGDTVSGIEYTVVKGDKMYLIARNHDISIQDLLLFNPQFDKGQLYNWKLGDRPAKNDRVGNKNRNPNWIYPGEKLAIKVAASAPDIKPEPKPEPKPVEKKVDTSGREGVLFRVKFKKSYGYKKKRRDYYDYNKSNRGKEGVLGIDIKFIRTMPLNSDSIRSDKLAYVKLDGGALSKHKYSMGHSEIEEIIKLLERVGYRSFKVIKK